MASSRSSPEGRDERRARVPRGWLTVVTSSEFTQCRVFRHTVDYLDTPLIRSGTMSEHLDVVIVGAGISGISAAWHLQDRCPTKSYAILERRENLGGTWDLFKYPGIRSDSDMFTLGFRFKPWTSEKAIADGPSIMAYLKETVCRVRHRQAHPLRPEGRRRGLVRRRQPLDASRRPGRRRGGDHRLVPVRRAVATTTTTRAIRRSSSDPRTSRAPSSTRSTGPRTSTTQGKKIVVIGSGATAVTLIPALANSGAGHVTMLQRSPTYIGSLPDVDPFTVRVNKHAAREAGLCRQPVEEHPVPAPRSTGSPGASRISCARR